VWGRLSIADSTIALVLLRRALLVVLRIGIWSWRHRFSITTLVWGRARGGAIVMVI
jgi:hypothetical protein